ncbi:hypothetical protein Tco_0980686 [Tanacetum coccineum]
MGIEPVSTSFAPAPQKTPADMSDPDPLSYAKPRPYIPFVINADLPRERPSREIQTPRSLLLSPPSLGRQAVYISRDGVQVAMGSQLRLRFEQEVRLRKRATEKIAKHKQFEDFAEAEVDMKNPRGLRMLISCKRNLGKPPSRYAKMDARLDALSIDFDEELYPHMLTAIAGRRWVIRHGLRLAAGRDLADVEAYDPEANNKLVKALQDLKDLKYPMIDQLEKLKDWIRDLRPSSSQLKISIYPEVRAPEDPWAVKEEVPLEDAIAANISRAEKKKKCRVVCRTHGIGSAHHVRSDGIPVSVPTIVPQGLAILLTDAGTQTQRSEDEASLRLLRSKSLPPMYNLVWP